MKCTNKNGKGFEIGFTECKMDHISTPTIFTTIQDSGKKDYIIKVEIDQLVHQVWNLTDLNEYKKLVYYLAGIRIEEGNLKKIQNFCFLGDGLKNEQDENIDLRFKKLNFNETLILLKNMLDSSKEKRIGF
jgi:hypothetical protein